MLDSILFNSENRLIGGAAGDLGLYGATSDTSVAIHAAQQGGSTEPEQGSATGTAPATASSFELDDFATPAQLGRFFVGDDAAGSSSSTIGLLSVASQQAPTATVAEVQPTQPVPAPLAEWAPAVTGAGSFTQSIAPAPSAAPSTAPTTDSLAKLESLHDAPFATPLVLVGGVLSGTVSPLLHGAGELIEGVVSPLGDIAGGLLADVGSTVSGLLGDDGLGGAVDGLLGGIGDTLSDLGGSDPLGGIATLVSLVSVGDIFGLHATEAPMADASSGLGAGSLDMLIGDLPLVGALLGGDDHHDGAHGPGGLDGALDHPFGL